MIKVEVRWGPSIHRFNKPFDHGFLSVILALRWKTSKNEKIQRSNFTKNTETYEIRSTSEDTSQAATQDLASEYDQLTNCTQEIIKEVVPEKNG